MNYIAASISIMAKKVRGLRKRDATMTSENGDIIIAVGETPTAKKHLVIVVGEEHQQRRRVYFVLR